LPNPSRDRISTSLKTFRDLDTKSNFFLYTKDKIKKNIIGSIGDIKFDNVINELMASRNLIITDHEIHSQKFEKACNDFIRLRTYSAFTILEKACSHYKVLFFINLMGWD
jgi:hypothetical protein